MYLRTHFFLLLLLPFPFLSQREHSWRNVRLTFAQESKYSSKGKTSCTWISRRPFPRQTHNCLQLRVKCSSSKCFQYNVSRLSSLWLGTQGRKQLAAELCQSVANWRGVSATAKWLAASEAHRGHRPFKCFPGSLFHFPDSTWVRPLLPEGGTGPSALAEVTAGAPWSYSLCKGGDCSVLGVCFGNSLRG